MKKFNIGQYVEKYRTIRRGESDLVLIEGIHAFKHALRFGADFKEILYTNKNDVKSFSKNVLKEKEKDFILKKGQIINDIFFNQLTPYKIRSKILAVAKKPNWNIDKINKNKPIIFLENPANPENVGMSIRVAAALGAGALVTTGNISPFSSSVIRSGVGLIFALPVFKINSFLDLKNFKNRILISADPEGKNLKKQKIPKNSIIIFGTEREGVSSELKKKSNLIIKIPMKKKISSLNLAMSVTIFLFYLN